MIFVEAATSEADIELVASELADMPLLFNWAEGGRTPPLPYDRLQELGFAIVIFPLTALLTAMASVRTVLAKLKSAGTPADLLQEMAGFNEFVDFIGLGEIHELERRFTA